MARPNRNVIEELSHEESGERHRIVHVELGRHSFYEIQRFDKGRGQPGSEDWDRIGATHKNLDEARESSRLQALHVVEVKSLPRPQTYHGGGTPPRTPWGPSQYAYSYGEGIESHGTAGHGGYKLDRKRNAQVHEALRAKGGWYEEDGDWAVVAHTFPELFTTYERDLARKSLMNSRPDEYTAATGVAVALEDSTLLRARAFKEETKDKWVVVSAIRSSEDKTMVIVDATLGGKRPGYGEEWNDRKFLVPGAEYENRSSVGFVIDLERHEEILPPAPAPGM